MIVSPLALNKENFSKVVTILDSSITSSSSTFALHALSSSSTLFLSGKDVAAYVQSLETDDKKVQVLDFTELASTAPPQAAVAPAASAPTESAAIEGAVQIAIGVKKEVDFAAWYTNVRVFYHILTILSRIS